MKFGERVKAILMFKKIHQRNFAQSIGISESQLSKLLNSKKKPSTKELMKIIDVLNVPYDCLIGNVPLFDELLCSSSSICSLW